MNLKGRRKSSPAPDRGFGKARAGVFAHKARVNWILRVTWMLPWVEESFDKDPDVDHLRGTVVQIRSETHRCSSGDFACFVFLASDASSLITVKMVSVDGGLTIT
jgi:hypothetical protein